MPNTPLFFFAWIVVFCTSAASFNRTTTTTTLSCVLRCMALSTSRSASSCAVLLLRNSLLARVTASRLEYTSHIPSDAIIKNSSDSSTSISVTSGIATTGSPVKFTLAANSAVQYPSLMPCSSRAWRLSFPLNSASPNARVTASISITRPFFTQPPTDSIRFVSLFTIFPFPYALCSVDRSTALPPLHRTARLSPTLATMILSGLARMQVAVEPVSSRGSPFAVPFASNLRISLSISWKTPGREAENLEDAPLMSAGTVAV
mmetsp:Transcript_825/g.2498  ORF Transcript_825/g.2498 Transcript_825/m.2498 type:complete len:261 (+) Transcript_825:1722-2504(+)